MILDWENYQQKQTPIKKTTKQPKTTITKWFICLPPPLQHILIEQRQDNFNRHSHLEREKMGSTQELLILSNSKILLDIHFEDDYPGGKSVLCVFSLSVPSFVFSWSIILNIYQSYWTYQRSSFWIHWYSLFFCSFLCHWFLLYYFLIFLNLGLICSSNFLWLKFIDSWFRTFIFSNISISRYTFSSKNCFSCIPETLICCVFIFIQF